MKHLYKLTRFVALLSGVLLSSASAFAAVKIADEADMLADPLPTNMLHVKADDNPVRFEGMMPIDAGVESDFLVAAEDGVIKRFKAKIPLLVYSAQSDAAQTYSKESFGSNSKDPVNHNILEYTEDDVVLIYDDYLAFKQSTNEWTVRQNGSYEMSGHANYLLDENASVGNIKNDVHVAVVVMKLEPGSTEWVPSVGNRCGYPSEFEGLTGTCVFQGIDYLVTGTQLRVDLYRGIGYAFTGPAPVLTSSDTGNGITSTRSFRIVYYPK